MPPEHAREFGGGLAQTALNPAVMVALLLALCLIFFLPRRRLIIPLLSGTLLIPLSQAVVMGGIHLFVSRILVLASLARLSSASPRSDPNRGTGWRNAVDTAFFATTLSQAIAAILLFLSVAVFINQVGFLIDFLATYYVLRVLIRGSEDVYVALKCVACLVVILGICMVIEQIKLVNVFGYIGAARMAPEIRDGKIRSQGVFSHSLLAGTFGATLMPLMVLLFQCKRAKGFAVAGLLGCTAMTITSNSSTPLLAYASALVGICFWPLRGKMQWVRRAIVALFAGLALVMKAPVWFIIARVDLTGSSSGYHRAALVDQFIRHFSDWWLIGIKDTGSWGWDMWDAQNQYVNVGETGGLLAFVFFIRLLCLAFGRIGGARKAVAGNHSQEWSFWLLGAAMLSHIVGFFGVNYFDQSRIGLLLLFCAITAMGLDSRQSGEARCSHSRKSCRAEEWYSAATGS